MVLELVEKHSSQMDISVTSSGGSVWHDVLNQKWLIEFVGIWTISKVKSYIIGILLTITGNCDYNRAWHIHWLCRDNDVSFSSRLWIIYLLTKANLLVAHVWMAQRFTNNADTIDLVHWTVWWNNLFDVWVIIIIESDIRN